MNRHVPILFFIITFAGVVFYAARKPVLLAIGDFLVVQDVLRPADIIHVIAGPDHRTDYGIELYKKGYAKRIVFTGGWCSLHNIYHGQHGKERALEQDVPLEAIVIDESEVKSTYSEVERLKEFIHQSNEPIRSVIVVSDPHHMRRARWAYRRVLENVADVQMAPVPFGSSPYQRMWWEDKESRTMVKDEYTKFAYYLARYRLSWGSLRTWLASLDRD